MRRLLALGLIAIFTTASVDLLACGDKFVRIGRSARRSISRPTKIAPSSSSRSSSPQPARSTGLGYPIRTSRVDAAIERTTAARIAAYRLLGMTLRVRPMVASTKLNSPI